MALPLQVTPLPVALVLDRAIVQELLEPPHVAVTPGGVRQGHVLEVLELPGTSRCSSAITVPLLLQLALVPEAHRRPDQRQGGQRADHHQGRLGGPAPGPQDGPLPEPDPPRPDRLVLQEPPQLVGQLLGRRVPLGRLLGHRLQQDRLQVAGHRRVELPRRRRLLLGDLPQDLLRGLARRWPAARSAARRASPPASRCRSGRRSPPAWPAPARGSCTAACPGCRRSSVKPGLPWIWASPKSATQNWPWSSSRRLAGLMSRWRMPRVWAWSSASAACTPELGHGADIRAAAGRGAGGGPAAGAGCRGGGHWARGRASPARARPGVPRAEAVASRSAGPPVPLASRPPTRLAARVEVEMSARFAAGWSAASRPSSRRSSAMSWARLRPSMNCMA